MTTKELKKEIARRETAFCKENGFKKRGYQFVKKMSDSVEISIGFGQRTYKGNCFVGPAMMIDYLFIHQFFERLLGEPYGGGIGRPLGYLTSRKMYYEWGFCPTVDNEAEFSDMFKTIERDGFSFFERMKDLDFYFNLLLNREKFVLCNVDWDLPALHYMKGEKEKGMKIINESIREQLTPKTEEQILNGTDPAKAIIMDYKCGFTIEEAMKRLNKMPSGSKIIFDSGNGIADPQYLKFAEAYAKLE